MDDPKTVRSLLRESYITFMDECEELWRRLLDCDRAACALAAGAGVQGGTSLEELTGRCDGIRGDLEAAMAKFARRWSSAWSEAGTRSIDPFTAVHAGIAQANAGYAYGTLSGVLASAARQLPASEAQS